MHQWHLDTKEIPFTRNDGILVIHPNTCIYFVATDKFHFGFALNSHDNVLTMVVGVQLYEQPHTRPMWDTLLGVIFYNILLAGSDGLQ